MSKKAIKVLLVEDSESDVFLIKQSLRPGEGGQFEMQRVEMLHEAIATLAGEAFDVVLLDLGLPDSQGFETLTRLQEKTANIPIIVLTGLDDEGLGGRAVQQGAQDYLVKGSLNGLLLSRTIRYAIERKRSEAALLESGRRFEDLVNSIEGIVWEADAKTYEVKFASRQMQRLLGYSEEDWRKTPDFLIKIIHPDDRDEAVARCKEEMEAGRNHVLEYRVRTAGGRVLWVRDAVTVVTKNGEPVKLLGVMVDITDRKEAEIRLKEKTGELERSNAGLDRFNRLAVGRELRMIELKREVNQLAKELGKNPPYEIGSDRDDADRDETDE